MKSLEESRRKIDEIDKEIVKLFEERMNTVIDVAMYKKEHNLDILNTKREAIVVENAINNLNDKKYSEEVADLFNCLMDISKNFQRKTTERKESIITREKSRIDLIETANKVGYTNIVNDLSKEAIKVYYQKDIESILYENYEDILQDIEDEKIDYALIAVDNISEGRVAKLYSLLETYKNVYVKDNFVLDDEFNKVEISTKVNNLNRFVIFGKNKNFSKESNKIDILIKIDSRSRSLSHLVRFFSNYNVKINRINSVLTNKYTKEFTIFITFNGSLQDYNIKKLLLGLQGDLPYIRIVGAYEA